MRIKLSRLILNPMLIFLLFAAVEVSLFAIDPLIELSPEEISWLDNHSPLRVSYEQVWMPEEYDSNRIPTGFSISYMNEIANLLGVQVQYISDPERSDLVKMIHDGELDVVLDVAATANQKNYMNFTDVYYENPNVLISSEKNIYPDLTRMKGKQVLILEDNSYLNHFENNYPDVVFTPVGNMGDALKAVSSGVADAVLGELSSSAFFIKEYKLYTLVISSPLDTGNTMLEKRYIGVRKDWPLLTGIIQKAMSAFPPEEFERICNTWFELSQNTASNKKTAELSLFQQIGILIIFFIILAAGVVFFLSRQNLKIENMKSRNRWLFFILALMSFVILVILFAWISQKKIDTNQREELANSLEAVLETTAQALDTWVEFGISMVSRDSGNVILTEYVENYFKAPPADSELKRIELQNYISGSLTWLNEEVYQIISKNFTVVASNNESLIGTQALLYSERRSMLLNVFNGIPSYIIALNDEEVEDENGITHFFAAPLRGGNGEVIAVLARSDDPQKTFSKLAQFGRIGDSGETYAFDSNGRMISLSHYNEDLIKLGLIEPSQTSILNINLKDPGGNLYEGYIPSGSLEEMPLTYMASLATRGFRGSSTEGYRDYRGVPVFGAWLWDLDNNYGLATEMDMDEGLASSFVIRNTLIVMLSITVLLAVGTSLISLLVSEKANRALSNSKNILEKRVKERTLELSDANRNLNNTIEALTHPFYVIDATNYEIILANKAALSMGSENAKTCYNLTHLIDEPCAGTDHICPLVEVKKNKKPYVVEHVHRDSSGNSRYIEVHGYPILDDSGEVVQMIEYNLDITDRKVAENKIKENEKRLQSLLEAGPDGMIIVDTQHLITQVNKQTEKMFNYRRSELIGSSIKTLVPELLDDSSLIPRLKNKERIMLETAARRKDGNMFPADISLSPITTAEGTLIVSAVRDVTLRKETELAIKQNLEELELFTRLTIGREEKMIQLKSEINELLKRSDQAEKYVIVSDQDESPGNG